MLRPGPNNVFPPSNEKCDTLECIPFGASPLDVPVFHGHSRGVDVAIIIFEDPHISTSEVNYVKLCLKQICKQIQQLVSIKGCAKESDNTKLKEQQRNKVKTQIYFLKGGCEFFGSG